MYTAGIIGCGSIGVNSDGKHPECHAWAYRECKDTELTYLGDIDEGREIDARRDWNVWGRIHTDILSICSPPEDHLDNVAMVAEYYPPKAIYLEKPIATTLEDADRIIELCHRNNIILQVNHQRRFGTPTFYFSRGILNTGTHMFDMLRMLSCGVRIEQNIIWYFTGLTIHKLNIIEVDTDECIFEFKIPTEGLILKGVEHLVECIKENKQSISSGEEAREALKLCLQYQKLKNS